MLVKAADHFSDYEVLDEQARSMLPTTASILHAGPLHAMTQDAPTYFSAQVMPACKKSIV